MGYNIEIGGQKIDKQYGHWLDIWNELTDHDESEWIGLNKHAAKNAYGKSEGLSGTTKLLQLYIPLQFWFCRNPGLALPLIALQYHEVKVKFTTRAMNGLVVGDFTGGVENVKPGTVNLWADYIYLDTDERRRFAQVSHEYLIEQLQREQGTAATSKKLNFNHPVKELIWVNQDATNLTEGAEGTGEDVSINLGGAAMTELNLSDNDAITGKRVNDERTAYVYGEQLEGWQALCSSLSASSIASVNVSGCGLTSVAINPLAEAIKVMAAVTSLNLDSNDLFGDRRNPDKFAAQCEPFFVALKDRALSTVTSFQIPEGDVLQPAADLDLKECIVTQVNFFDFRLPLAFLDLWFGL